VAAEVEDAVVAGDAVGGSAFCDEAYIGHEEFPALLGWPGGGLGWLDGGRAAEDAGCCVGCEWASMLPTL
jgi:hypothetical protein